MLITFLRINSMYKDIRLLADNAGEVVESVAGCQAKIFRVPENPRQEVLKKLDAPENYMDPHLAHDMLHKLQEASGIICGPPARFGMMSAQIKQLLYSTVQCTY